MSCTAADLWELQNSLKSLCHMLLVMFWALRATPHFTIFTQCMFFFYVLSKEFPQSLESENIIWLCFLSHLPFPHCLVTCCRPQVQHFWICWDKTKICKPCQMLPVPFNDNDCISSVLIFLFFFFFCVGLQLHQVEIGPHCNQSLSGALQDGIKKTFTLTIDIWTLKNISQRTHLAKIKSRVYKF